MGLCATFFSSFLLGGNAIFMQLLLSTGMGIEVGNRRRTAPLFSNCVFGGLRTNLLAVSCFFQYAHSENIYLLYLIFNIIFNISKVQKSIIETSSR